LAVWVSKGKSKKAKVKRGKRKNRAEGKGIITDKFGIMANTG
jgi:hypothetical protein